jgi:hypothetical protein
MKINWILLGSFFLLAVCLSLLIITEYENEKALNINGIEIKSNQFSNIVNNVGEGNFVICDMRSDKCSLFFKGGLK